MGELMGLLSNANPGSHGSIGLTPLEEPLLELLEEFAEVVPPEPFPAPAPAAPEDSMFAVPPSPPGGGLVDEHAANPTRANPKGTLVQRMLVRMTAMLARRLTLRNRKAGPRCRRLESLRNVSFKYRASSPCPSPSAAKMH